MLEQDLLSIVARLLGKSEGSILAEVERRARNQERRVERQNARYLEALEQITEAQAKAINDLCSKGAKPQSSLRQSRKTGRVVIFLQRSPVWHEAKGRMGCILYAVYPDGSISQTYERTLSVRSDF